MYRRFVTSLLALILLIQPIAPAFAAQGTEELALDFIPQYAFRSPQGSAQDAASDGSYRYAHELDVPPGRNDLTPALSLNYASNQADPYSPFGEGWSLSIPSISRQNKTGLDYAGTDFISSLDGELVDQGNGIYHARVENGAFRSYELANDTFTVTETDGTEYVFGSTAQARQDDPSDSTRIHTWMLEQTTDSNGNEINYTYFKDNGQIYIDQVSYNQSGTFTVEFERSATSRAAIATSYRPAFAVETHYEITQIDIKVDGTLERRYDLSFTDGLLKDITTTGYESGANPVSLPATEFTYAQESDTNSWTRVSGGELPQNEDGDSLPLFSDGYFYAHADDDGRIDYFKVPRYSQQAGNGRLYTKDHTTTWTEVPTSSFTYPSIFAGQYDHTLPGDFDGDGDTDFVYTKTIYENTNPDPHDEYGFYMNNGDYTWSLDTNYILPNDNTVLSAPDTHVVAIDTNGDGHTDLIYGRKTNHSNYTSNDPNFGVWINNADGTFTRDANAVLPLQPSGDQQTLRSDGADWRDATGDGFIDYIRYPEVSNQSGLPTQFNVWVNQGDNTWERDVNGLLPQSLSGGTDLHAHSQRYPHVFPAYADGDRFLDYVFSEGITENDETNKGFGLWLNDEDSTWTGNNYAALPQPPSSNNYDTDQTVLDIDKDGIDEWVSAPEYGDDYHPANLHQGFFKSDRSPHGQLTKIVAAEGGITRITYEPAHEHDASNAMPGVHNVVTAVATDDGFGTLGTTSYQYQDGDFYYASSTERRFAGFGTIIETQPDGTVVTTKFHQGNGETGNEPTDSYAKLGKVYERTIEDDQGNLYVRERNTYTDYAHGSGAQSSLLTSSLTQHYDGDSDHKDRAEAFTYDLTHGGVLTHVEYGEVSGNADGTFTDTETDSRTTTNVYASNGTTNVVAPHTSTLTDHSSNTVTETKLSYDNLAHGSVGVGNVTTEAVWIDGSNYAETDHTYNTDGQRLSTTDPENNTTTYSYDAFGLYPATTTNALSHHTTFTYDYSSGEVLTTTDANGNTTRSEFDGLDRLTAEYAPDPQTGSEVQQSATTYTDTRGAFATYRDDYLSSTNLVTTKTYLDGFNRPIQTRAEGESDYLVTDTVYNPDGTVAKESIPYEDAGLSRSTMTSLDALVVEYTYDPLDRVTQVATALGDTDTAYDQWTETVTDPENNDKTYTKDAFDRLVSVDEIEGASTYTTEYQWRADDLLTLITDADDNERAIAYDGRGLRTSLEDLHDPADTNFGTWTFTYDDAGNVLTQADPNGDTTTYTYDDLNRVLTEDSDATSGTDITYTYDSCTEGVGRLCSAGTSDVTTDYEYAHTAAIATEDRTIAGTTYTTEYEYDRQGNQTKVTYPDNSDVTYSYNDRGLIEDIKQRESGETYTTIIEDFDYAPHGLVDRQVHSNGFTTTYTFDEQGVYRLQSLVTDITGTGGAGAEHAAIELELSEALPEAVVVETDIAVSTQEVAEPAEAPTDTEPIEAAIEEDVAATTTTPPAALEVIELGEEPTDETVVPDQPKKPKKRTANEKASEVAKTIKHGNKFHKKDHKIQITDHNLIDDGIEVFARAWKNNQQKGFGRDGSVDIERFRIFNPPLLVPDPHGKIISTVTDPLTGETFETRFREDPEAALKTVLEQAVALTGQSSTTIKAGKIGNTTDIYYPSFDGAVGSRTGTYSGMLSGTNRMVDDSSYYLGMFIGMGVYYNANASNKWQSDRGFVNFDTSPIVNTDVVDSATLELYPITIANTVDTGNDFFTVTAATPASDTSLSTSDWNNAGAATNPTDLISRVDFGDLTAGAYNAFPLNADGEDHIDLTGITNFGLRGGDESSGVQPNFSHGDNNRVLFYASEQTGTTLDPKLTVEHSAPSSGNSTTSIQHYTYEIDNVGNITSIVEPGATTTYAYDDLYRLTSAARTTPIATEYSHTYAYDGLGNITNKSDQGAYSYDGHTGSSYANPHAATDIAGATLDYDNNGNLLSDGNATNTWTYRNTLASTDTGNDTITYGYDHTNQRVIKSVASAAGGSGALEFEDTMTNPNSYNLNLDSSSHVPELGGGWTKLIDVNTCNFLVHHGSDQIIANISPCNSSEGALYRTDSQATHADVEVSLLQLDGDTNDDTSMLACRIQDEDNMYAVEWNEEWSKLYKRVSGTWTELDYNSADIADGSTVKLICDGTSITVEDDGSEILSATDSDISTAGYGGLGMGAVITSTHDLSSQNLDDFRMTTLNGAAATTTDTVYVNGLYEVDDGAITKHIYAGDTLVATVEGSGATAEVFHAHLDHLGSTRVMTDDTGATTQELDYYPFGAERVDTQSGSHDQSNRYTGHDYDGETALSYMKARYYSGDMGRFQSQDPLPLALGDVSAIEEKAFGPYEEVLKRPQMLNTYTYALNNPLKLTDPLGETPPLLVLIGHGLTALGLINLSFSAHDYWLTNIEYPDVFTETEQHEAQFSVTYNGLTTAASSVLPPQYAVPFDATLLATEMAGHAIERSTFDQPLDYVSTPDVLQSQIEPELRSRPLLPSEQTISSE